MSFKGFICNLLIGLHSEFTRYYCACKNPLCGHRFVMNMEFGHTTRASKLTKDKLLEL
ncbi:MAG: ogr/Delta-like zinc finger family protein, partial [Haemophilus parainfluenzae]|nr:ogr/Delta-like zinc finger family protein [Haemophilus parainfluenzae]